MLPFFFLYGQESKLEPDSTTNGTAQLLTIHSVAVTITKLSQLVHNHRSFSLVVDKTR